MSSEYRAHVARLQARAERQAAQLEALEGANEEAGQALMRCKAASEAAEHLGAKVRRSGML